MLLFNRNVLWYNIVLKYYTGKSCCWKHDSGTYLLNDQVFGPWTVVYLLDLTHLVENDTSIYTTFYKHVSNSNNWFDVQQNYLLI